MANYNAGDNLQNLAKSTGLELDCKQPQTATVLFEQTEVSRTFYAATVLKHLSSMQRICGGDAQMISDV